jgi:hypothetical protein
MCRMKIIFPMLMLASILIIDNSYAFDLPHDALQLLAETTVESCSICAKQKMEKAFSIFNSRFMPGQIIKSDDTCRFVKMDAGDDNEMSLTCYPSDALIKSLKDGEMLPKIVFKFYTPQQRLVGISENDYADKRIADLFHELKPGTVFEGRIKLIPYKYGDGPTYNYFPQMNRLQIHCAVLELKPAVP